MQGGDGGRIRAGYGQRAVITPRDGIGVGRSGAHRIQGERKGVGNTYFAGSRPADVNALQWQVEFG